MEKRIDEAETALKQKGNQARTELSELLIQAAEIVKGEE
jgi:hypothetical protein